MTTDKDKFKRKLIEGDNYCFTHGKSKVMIGTKPQCLTCVITDIDRYYRSEFLKEQEVKNGKV